MVPCYSNKTSLALHESSLKELPAVSHPIGFVLRSLQQLTLSGRKTVIFHFRSELTRCFLCTSARGVPLWALTSARNGLRAMKLLRDREAFFYFRVTISLNNAWLWGGVAEGPRGAEMHSWVKLYIIITAGEVASDGAGTATPLRPAFYASVLFNISKD